jgi:hypothetical protein
MIFRSVIGQLRQFRTKQSGRDMRADGTYDRTALCSGKLLGGARLGHRFSVVSLSPSRKRLGRYVHWTMTASLENSFQFIIHMSSQHSTLHYLGLTATLYNQ